MFGWSSLIGIAVIPLSAPLSFYVSKAIYRTDKAWAAARDARTAALKEFFLGFKVIKLNGFEPYFKSRIETLRAQETKCVRFSSWLQALLY